MAALRALAAEKWDGENIQISLPVPHIPFSQDHEHATLPLQQAEMLIMTRELSQLLLMRALKFSYHGDNFYLL